MAFQTLFLIDECLSPELANIHIEFAEIAHVNHRALAGRSDPMIARWCVEHDAVLVTNNARDFKRIYKTLPLHPGLVIILPTVLIPVQIAMMTRVVDRWDQLGDGINKLIEVSLAGEITISDWPPVS